MLVAMSTFVIVHGAWGGGWEWSPVADLLRENGHVVFTPTLTGMGERAHLDQRGHVGLAAHVEDVVAVMAFEDLRKVVLVGASYGGMPVTGAGDRAGDRVSMVVYVDALVPLAGQCALDLLPQAFGDMVRTGVDEHGTQWRVPMPTALSAALFPVGSLADDIRARYLARVRDQPAATFMEPIHLEGTIDRLPRAFVRCTAAEFPAELGDPIEACARRARAAGWPYRELPAPHDPQVFDPSGIATILHELADVASASARGVR
jgi:pimeloyl-ACP methyl ester carboxylesterase